MRRPAILAAAALAVAAAFLSGRQLARWEALDACLDAGGGIEGPLCAVAVPGPPGLHLGPIRLSAADILEMERAATGNGLVRVTLRLAPEAAAALAGYTGAMRGRDLILAMDGVRTSGVRIVAPITGGRVTMAMALAQADELEAMAGG